MKSLQALSATIVCFVAGCGASEPLEAGNRPTNDNRGHGTTDVNRARGETPSKPANVPVSRTPQRKKTKVGSDGVLRLRPVKIYDRQGWNKPIPARVLLAPADWKVDGGVQWQIRAFKGEKIQERFAITRPDGLARLEKIPVFHWGNSNVMQAVRDLRAFGTRVARAATAEQAVRQFVLPALRADFDVELISIKRDKKESAAATKAFQAMFAKSPATAELRVTVELFAAKIAYEVNGKACEENLMLRLLRTRGPNVSRQMRQFAGQFGMNAGPRGVIDRYFLEGFAFRVPQGEWKKHEPLMTTILASTRQNPSWVQAIARHRHKMNQIRLNGMRNRHQIRMQTQREIAEMQQWGWEKRQAIRDQQAAKYSRSIREVELYRDPTLGRDIELGAGYKFVYRNGNGDYLLFNNPLFDPNVELEGEWQKLRQAE